MSILDTAPDHLRFLTPEQWGMEWANPPVAERLDDTEGYVHHRAGNPRTDTDAAQVFREMNAYAINVRHYSAVAYDGLVHEHRSGLVTVGLARGRWRSAATLDRNEVGEAWCAIGYFHPGSSLSARPSSGMLDGLAYGLAWSTELGHLLPGASILGHRDNPAHPNATTCPGDYLYPHLPTIRQRLAAILDEQDPDMYTATLPTVSRQRSTSPAERRAVARVESVLVGYCFTNGLDVPNSLDGQWSDVTEAAVRHFQARRGLAVDGIVGPRTWAELIPSA